MNDSVTLTFLANTRNVSLARTVAAAMSARADLTLDRLEDVRLAVDEAVSQLITDSPPDAPMHCAFSIDDSQLEVRVWASSLSGEPPKHDTFSWTVLTALVDQVTATVSDGTASLHLRIGRHVPVDA